MSKKRSRKRLTDEFKAETVKLVKQSDRSMSAMSQSRFTWGDSVRVAELDGVRIDWRPGSVGSVCGLRTIENEKQARSSSFEVGTIVYTVEFGDGETQQIPEAALESVD